MKITGIHAKKIRTRLNAPFTIAFARVEVIENVLVKVTCDEGIDGYGEAAPFTPVTGETADGVMTMLDVLRPHLLGKDPLAIGEIHTLMNIVAYGNPSAKCAVDMALHDLWGKAVGQPLYRLLGGTDPAVQTDVTVGIGSPKTMAQTAWQYVDKMGYRVLKVKAGAGLERDIEAFKAIRAAVGGQVRLRADANQAYNLVEATALAEALSALGVEAVEQCLPYWDMEGAAQLRTKVHGIRLILDEAVHDPRDAVRACTLTAADMLNIKLMKCGGIEPALQINAIAADSGVECLVGCMFETRLAITAGLCLVAARRSNTQADCDSYMFYDNAQHGITGGFTAEGDVLCLLEEPGLGVQVDF